MARRQRRNHSSAFKAKVALAALKGDKTLTLKYYAAWLPKEGKKYVHLLDSVPEQKEAIAR